MKLSAPACRGGSIPWGVSIRISRRPRMKKSVPCSLMRAPLPKNEQSGPGKIQHDYVGTVLHPLQNNFMAVWRNVEVVDFEVGSQVGQLPLSACLPVDNPEIFVLYFSPQNHEGPSSGKEGQMPGPAGKFHGRQSVRFAFGSDGLNGKRGPNV